MKPICKVGENINIPSNKSNKSKKSFNVTRKIFSSKPKTEKNKLAKQEKLEIALRIYIDQAGFIIEKAKIAITDLSTNTAYDTEKINIIENFIQHAERQVDQIKRRHFN